MPPHFTGESPECGRRRLYPVTRASVFTLCSFSCHAALQQQPPSTTAGNVDHGRTRLFPRLVFQISLAVARRRHSYASVLTIFVLVARPRAFASVRTGNLLGQEHIAASSQSLITRSLATTIFLGSTTCASRLLPERWLGGDRRRVCLSGKLCNLAPYRNLFSDGVFSPSKIS
ncbi:hypothetical protein DFH06DRAFT_50861 [Mycena polygramma]|nr:hypothetical protein DFH06DRAFT_50861 [Mycena polygramma]